MISVILGGWLMVTPEVAGYGGASAVNDYICGALVLAFSFVAIWGVLRPLRWAGLVLGVWVFFSPILLDYSVGPHLNHIGIGAALVALSFFGGSVRKSFGGGWRAFKRREH